MEPLSHADGGGRHGLRITCVICSLAPGGAQRNLLRLAEGLAGLGHTVTLLTLDPFGPDFYSMPVGIARVRANPAAFWAHSWRNLPGNWRRYRSLRRSILATRPDTVISFIDTTNIDVLLALKNSRVPVIVSERVDPRFHRIGWVRNVMRWWLYPTAACVVLVARDSHTWAQGFFPRWKTAVIPNPVVALAARPYCADSKLIVSMGRLVGQKGYDLLISAFARIAGDCPEWTIKILGDGPERATLAELIRRSGLEARIELVGARKEPFQLMSQCSFFVLPSRYEGFPMALAEAMSLGLPVISFDCPSGPRELLRPETDGLLVPAQDVPALACAMRRLIDDAGLRAKFARNAREVTLRFPVKTFIWEWVRVVQAAIKARQ